MYSCPRSFLNSKFRMLTISTLLSKSDFKFNSSKSKLLILLWRSTPSWPSPSLFLATPSYQLLRSKSIKSPLTSFFSYFLYPVHHETMLAIPPYYIHHPPPLLPLDLRNFFHLVYFDSLLKDLPTSITAPTQSIPHARATAIHAKPKSDSEFSIQNPKMVFHFTMSRSQTSDNIMRPYLIWPLSFSLL